jgi:hypothetical protein
VSTPQRGSALTFDDAVAAFRGAGPVRVSPGDLDAFLVVTSHLDDRPAELLRRLAIALESDRFENGWADLRAIYQAALDLEPDYAHAHHSLALAAEWYYEDRRLPREERIAIAGEAEAALANAERLQPGDSRIVYAVGLLWYNHPAHRDDPATYRTRALSRFEEAVALDATNVMAQLYAAHCYHDGHDWPAAIAAYERVDLARLAAERPAWRAVKCREQLAACHAAAGHLDEARRRFLEWLDAAEAWQGEALEDRVVNVDELVWALTHYLHDRQVEDRTRSLVVRIGMQRRYPSLFA